MGTKRLLLIDASNITHRAWHAFPSTLTTDDGEPVNALYGFTKILMGVLDKLKPDYVCVVMDTDNRSGWRRKIDPDYKMSRGDHDDALVGQFRHIPSAIKALNLRADIRDGYEADDLIAAYCHRHKDDDLDILIVSGDKDFMQLLTQANVRLFDDMKSKTFGPDDTLTKFFVPAHQVTMVQAIAGDKIDDVVNLRGFGYKTAARFIGEHTTFKSLFRHLKELRRADKEIKAKSKKQFKAKHEAILGARKRILLNHKLVKLAKDAPLRWSLKKLRYEPPDPDTFRAFLEKFQFRSLMGTVSENGVRVSFVKGKPKKTVSSKPKAPPPQGSVWEAAKSLPTKKKRGR